MKKKRTLRINWLHEWQVLEHEAWFEDMAKKGWQLENVGNWLTSFVESDPEETSYRIEIGKKNEEIESSRIFMYRDAGWEYVSSKNHLNVFREEEVNKGKEVYTDPAKKAETMKVLKKSSRWNALIVSIATLLFILLLVIDYRTMSSYQLLSNSIFSAVFSVIIYLPVAFHSILGLLSLSSLTKRLENGERLDYYKTYKGKVLRIRAMSFLMTIVLVFFLSIQFTQTGAERFPETPSEPLPVIQLTDIEDIEPEEIRYQSRGYGYRRGNHFSEGESLLFPAQYRLHQEYAFPADEERPSYRPSIEANKYEARTNHLAEKLATILIEETYLPNQRSLEEKTLAGYDEIWVFEDDKQVIILARHRDTVYDIHYNGEQSSEAIYEWLERNRDGHSST